MPPSIVFPAEPNTMLVSAPPPGAGGVGATASTSSPAPRSIRVGPTKVLPDGTVTFFGPADTLTAEPVLPDFRVPVADLFRLPTATG